MKKASIYISVLCWIITLSMVYYGIWNSTPDNAERWFNSNFVSFGASVMMTIIAAIINEK